MASVYQINKAINRPIEMKGLKAQYIIYLAIGVVILLVGFIIAYLAGANAYLCVGIALTLGFFLFSYTYRFSNKYGEHGLIKASAYLRIPAAISCKSRKIFYEERHPIRQVVSESHTACANSTRGARLRLRPATKIH